MGAISTDYNQNNNGPPAHQAQTARNNDYDFIVSADHSQENPFQPVASDENVYWEDTREVSRNNRNDSSFVALTGIEYSRNVDNSDPSLGGGGHMNPMNIHNYVSALGSEAMSIPELFDWIKNTRPLDDIGHVVMSFNHPGPDQYLDWAHWDEEIVDIITMFELRTVFRGSGPRWNAYVRSLNKGWKTSPISVHDSHGYWNLANKPPLTNVYAPELTIEAITRAMRQRRTFTSWTQDEDTRIDLRYSVNGYIMGSTLDRPDTFKFHIEVDALSDQPLQYVKRIQILRDHSNGNLNEVEVVADKEFEGTDKKVVWMPAIQDEDANYFLLRIWHWNDMENNYTTYSEHGSTYSAPTWTGRGPRGNGTHEIHHAVESVSTPIQVATGAENVAAGNGYTMVTSKRITQTSTEDSFRPLQERPSGFRLHQNYPNPFNPSTEINYYLPNSEHVRLEIFDLLGQKVDTMVDEYQGKGLHHVTFDASHLSNGIYLYRIQAGSYVDTKKMTLLK